MYCIVLLSTHQVQAHSLQIAAVQELNKQATAPPSVCLLIINNL